MRRATATTRRKRRRHGSRRSNGSGGTSPSARSRSLLFEHRAQRLSALERGVRPLGDDDLRLLRLRLGRRMKVDVLASGLADRLALGIRRIESDELVDRLPIDRKSTRLNSSHANISYAVFC